MSSFLREKAAALNLFEENAIDQNPEVVRLGKIKTWLFLVLLPAGLAVYILFMFASKNIVTVSIAPTSYEHYQALLRAHPDLWCPCSRTSYALAEMLPPLLLQQASLRDVQATSDSKIQSASLDPIDWAAAGFHTYDAWCPRVFSTREDLVFEQLADQNVGVYWTWLCNSNECCRNLAPSPEDVPKLTQSHELPRWIVYYILGMRRDAAGILHTLPRIPESPFLNGWCTMVLNQRRSAIQQFWESLLVSSSLLSREALHQQLVGMWHSRYMTLHTTMRTLMAVQNGGCMLPGCPAANKKLSSALGAEQLLTPFATCNLTTLPLAVVIPPLDLDMEGTRGPQFGAEPVASANTSQMLDQFLLLTSFAFILDWRVNASDAHLQYYSRCAARASTYVTRAPGNILVFIGILLGVFSGGKELLKVGISVCVPVIWGKKQDGAQLERTKVPSGADTGSAAAAVSADGSIRVHLGVATSADDLQGSGAGPALHPAEPSDPDSDQEESAPLMHRASRM